MFRFFKDFLLYGVTSVLAKIIAIFLMPVYTSVLTQEEYGAMALITSCKGIIDIISNLNIHSAVAREYYEENINRKRLVSTGFFSILSLSLFVLIVMLISNNFWSSTILELPEQYSLAFCIMLCTLPAGSLFSYFSILTREVFFETIKAAISSIIAILVALGLGRLINGMTAYLNTALLLFVFAFRIV
jgi:O-antigen/teichoic acid export membrane protein